MTRSDVDINYKCGYQGGTIITEFCKEGFYSEHVRQTLFQDSRCDINIETNKGTPLFIAITCTTEFNKDHIQTVSDLIKCKNININAGSKTQSHLCCAVLLIQQTKDIFDDIACLILDHPDVNPNSECESTGITSLVHLLDSNLGQTKTAKKLASHHKLDCVANNLSFKLIPKNIHLLKLIIKNPKFNVNQRWSNNTGREGAADRHKETLAIYCANDIQKLTDEYGMALTLLCNAGADLNICERKESDSTLLRFLKRSNINRHFKAGSESLDILTFLLNRGANPNKPPHTLAFAINNCPFQVCKILLEHKANSNSFFRTDDKMIANIVDELSEKAAYWKQRNSATYSVSSRISKKN